MSTTRPECTACDQSFELDAEGNIPAHTKAIVGRCYGSDKPPASPGKGLNVLFRPRSLPDSKQDFEVSTRHAHVGHPGSGGRR